MSLGLAFFNFTLNPPSGSLRWMKPSLMSVMMLSLRTVSSPSTSSTRSPSRPPAAKLPDLLFAWAFNTAVTAEKIKGIYKGGVFIGHFFTRSVSCLIITFYNQKPRKKRKIIFDLVSLPLDSSLFCHSLLLPTLLVFSHLDHRHQHRQRCRCRRRCCRRCCRVLFCNGITWERFELSSWNFAWWLVMTLSFKSQFGFQFHPRRPAQPAKNLKMG